MTFSTPRDVLEFKSNIFDFSHPDTKTIVFNNGNFSLKETITIGDHTHVNICG